MTTYYARYLILHNILALHDILLIFVLQQANCVMGHFALSFRTYEYYIIESFNDWEGGGFDDSVPGDVARTALSGNRTI